MPVSAFAFADADTASVPVSAFAFADAVTALVPTCYDDPLPSSKIKEFCDWYDKVNPAPIPASEALRVDVKKR